jgi:DNA sulfur modification protein DndC
MGFRAVSQGVERKIQRLFLEDSVPWVVGYSGGKDSTATLQLVWNALKYLPEETRLSKKVYVISTDTLVESPIVARWVRLSLERMREEAELQRLPIEVHQLTPQLTDTFWVNLIGKGYAAPRNLFRWCTTRLKIAPSNTFIQDVVTTYGEAILILGTRKAESANRAQNMEKYEQKRVRDELSPSGSLLNTLVFTPIEDWSNDEVWTYLLQHSNPWGHPNYDLLSMYRGATMDGECPLVLDLGTPSCGNSRFGCWVCTLVDQDKSMSAMILNDMEKAWLTPLLELRNELGDFEKDRERRDFRRMHGQLLLHNDRLVPGPYTKEWREYWLRRLLEAEKQIQETAPPEFKDIKLITQEELDEIRRIWVEEKHEFDDSLPRIYQEVTGKVFKSEQLPVSGPFGKREWDLLRELCGGNELLFEMLTSLLSIAQRTKWLSLRRDVLDELEAQIRRSFYADREEAEALARKRLKRRNELMTAVGLAKERGNKG